MSLASHLVLCILEDVAVVHGKASYSGNPAHSQTMMCMQASGQLSNE